MVDGREIRFVAYQDKIDYDGPIHCQRWYGRRWGMSSEMPWYKMLTWIPVNVIQYAIQILIQNKTAVTLRHDMETLSALLALCEGNPPQANSLLALCEGNPPVVDPLTKSHDGLTNVP